MHDYKKLIEEAAEKHYPENISLEGSQQNRKQRKNQAIFKDACNSEIVQQIIEDAFNAGRERINHPDWDYVYETFQDYKNKNL